MELNGIPKRRINSVSPGDTRSRQGKELLLKIHCVVKIKLVRYRKPGEIT